MSIFLIEVFCTVEQFNENPMLLGKPKLLRVILPLNEIKPTVQELSTFGT